MNRPFAIVCLFLLLAAVCVAQRRIPNASATPSPRGTPNPNPTIFNPPPSQPPDPWALRQLILQKYAQPIYRKPTDKELRSIAPGADVLSAYAEFLKRPDTGIFRLLPDAGCAESTEMVDASEKCLKHSMPGAGSSYSFRTRFYRVSRLADLTYTENNLLVSGIFMHALLVRLGDVPLEGLTLLSPGMRYLVSFQPSRDYKKALAFDKVLSFGVRSDGYLYHRKLPASAQTTYALRTVAYRGAVYRAVRGQPYNELEFDKRRDLIVAFRIVRIEPDGSLIILWEELRNIDAPRIRLPAPEENARRMPERSN